MPIRRSSGSPVPSRLAIRAEAAANSSLGASYQLTEAQGKALEEAGWQAPDPGCPNFFCDFSQDAAEEVAELVVGALRDVYGVQHPVFLDPDQLAGILRTEPSAIEGPAGATPVASGTLLAADPAAAATASSGSDRPGAGWR